MLQLFRHPRLPLRHLLQHYFSEGAPAVTISPSVFESSPQDTSVHGIKTPIDVVDSNLYEPYIAPETILEASSSTTVNVDVTPNSPIAHVQKWTKDHPLDNVIGDMVNTRTDADLSAAVQNALQTLLPQIRAEIREEFRTSSGPSDAGGNPSPVIIHTWLERFNKQKPYSFEKTTAPVDAENWISHMEKIFDIM
nr:zinc finger, CCHC-type, retrotransposon Gag domain protein [Tanacetum cinerariifolium]